jgi:hypothetical protein
MEADANRGGQGGTGGNGDTLTRSALPGEPAAAARPPAPHLRRAWTPRHLLGHPAHLNPSPLLTVAAG